MSLRRERRENGASRSLRILGVLAILIAPAVASAPAHADPTREDRAAATALFDEARKLADQKKYPEACPKFEAAMRLDPGMGTLFNLSDCYEQLGRTASAWSGFRDVASMAKAENRPEREQVARDRAAALEPKLSKVRILVSADVPSAGLTITRDGSPVPSALVGSPIPFDPGAHVIRVVAEGREPWETKITVPAKGGVMDVQVPALAPKKDATPGPTATATATAAPSVTVSAQPTSTAGPIASGTPWVNPRPWQKPLGIAAAAVGVVGLGVGVGFGFIAKSTFDSSNKADCDEKTGFCNDAGLKTRADAVDQGNIGTAIGIAGGVIGAAGLALWIFSPSAPAGTKTGGSERSPLVAPRSGGLSSVRVAAGAGRMTISGEF